MNSCNHCGKIVWPWQSKSMMAWPTQMHLLCHGELIRDYIGRDARKYFEVLKELRAVQKDYPFIGSDAEDLIGVIQFP